MAAASAASLAVFVGLCAWSAHPPGGEPPPTLPEPQFIREVLMAGVAAEALAGESPKEKAARVSQEARRRAAKETAAQEEAAARERAVRAAASSKESADEDAAAAKEKAAKEAAEPLWRGLSARQGFWLASALACGAALVVGAAVLLLPARWRRLERIFAWAPSSSWQRRETGCTQAPAPPEPVPPTEEGPPAPPPPPEPLAADPPAPPAPRSPAALAVGASGVGCAAEETAAASEVVARFAPFSPAAASPPAASPPEAYYIGDGGEAYYIGDGSDSEEAGGRPGRRLGRSLGRSPSSSPDFLDGSPREMQQAFERKLFIHLPSVAAQLPRGRPEGARPAPADGPSPPSSWAGSLRSSPAASPRGSARPSPAASPSSSKTRSVRCSPASTPTVSPPGSARSPAASPTRAVRTARASPKVWAPTPLLPAPAGGPSAPGAGAATQFQLRLCAAGFEVPTPHR